MTLKAKLLGILAALSVAVICLVGWHFGNYYGDLRNVGRTQAINHASMRLIDAAKNLAVERGTMNGALSAPGVAADAARQAIGAARSKADAALQGAIRDLRGLARAEEVRAQLAKTEAAMAAVAELRRRADQEIAKPAAERDRAVTGAWFGSATDLIDVSQLLRRAAEEDVESVQAELKRLQAVAHAAWAVSEFAGRERGFVNAMIAGGAPVDAARGEFLAGLRGRVQLLWPELEMLLRMMPQDAELGAAGQAARAALLERYAGIRNRVIEAGRKGEPYPIPAADWFREATIAIDALLKLADLADARAGELAGETNRSALLALGLAAAAALASLALIGFGYLVIQRQVVSPLQRITGCMQRLAGGDNAAEIPDTGRRDEIGAMAAAVQVFKDNGIENERLRQNVEAERHQREAERAEQESMLDRSVGEVVGAAARGDLSRRIDTAPLAGVMRKVGDGINGLTATVEAVIGDVGQVLAAMAKADLTRRVERAYEGAFDRMKQDANATAEHLAELVRRLSTSVEAVHGASGEIRSGSQDLAGRTESQAASIEETAASMHEITETVKQNADNAQAANQLALSARDAAEKGGGVVGEAVAAVTRIEESARKISDIVGLIDEIAFQTNLLALNASVEAARAGEAGKGFAVVAQEVRALAQRSANASKDIKALIVESSGQVRTGAELVNRTGLSLGDIVVAVKKVSDIVAEIAAASREQATGLDQVNTAVANMDEMTQRNAALVEETTAAAQALNNQAEELSRIVGTFRLA